jgi:hypothetical protein
MMLCDLRRCRMADAVLALLRSRVCSTASTATLLRSRAAVAQCLLQGLWLCFTGCCQALPNEAAILYIYDK